MVKTLVLSAAIAIGLTGAAFAQGGTCTAVVDHVSGSLLVNRGHGFHHLLHRSVLHAGDVVMASGRGSGLVHFSDGLTGRVSVGNAVRVPGQLPCGPVAEYQSTEGAGSGPDGGLYAAGVVAAGGILLAIGALSANHSSQVSP